VLFEHQQLHTVLQAALCGLGELDLEDLVGDGRPVLQLHTSEISRLLCPRGILSEQGGLREPEQSSEWAMQGGCREQRQPRERTRRERE
jgi:hypothetical protein